MRINSVVANCRVKSAARNQILSLQKKKLFSTYQLYKTLDMNGENVNAGLKHGDNKKQVVMPRLICLSWLVLYKNKFIIRVSLCLVTPFLVNKIY